jgi:hypothetical protein
VDCQTIGLVSLAQIQSSSEDSVFPVSDFPAFRASYPPNLQLPS